MVAGVVVERDLVDEVVTLVVLVRRRSRLLLRLLRGRHVCRLRARAWARGGHIFFYFPWLLDVDAATVARSIWGTAPSKEGAAHEMRWRDMHPPCTLPRLVLLPLLGRRARPGKELPSQAVEVVDESFTTVAGNWTLGSQASSHTGCDVRRICVLAASLSCLPFCQTITDP